MIDFECFGTCLIFLSIDFAVRIFVTETSSMFPFFLVICNFNSYSTIGNQTEFTFHGSFDPSHNLQVLLTLAKDEVKVMISNAGIRRHSNNLRLTFVHTIGYSAGGCLRYQGMHTGVIPQSSVLHPNNQIKLM